MNTCEASLRFMCDGKAGRFAWLNGVWCVCVFALLHHHVRARDGSPLRCCLSYLFCLAPPYPCARKSHSKIRVITEFFSVVFYSAELLK